MMKTNRRFVEEWGLDSIGTETTGLPRKIVVLFGNWYNMRYGPSVMISNLRGRAAQHDGFFVSLSSQPEIIAGRPKSFTADELSAIYSWVVLNKDKLLVYWEDCSYSTSRFIDELKPL